MSVGKGWSERSLKLADRVGAKFSKKLSDRERLVQFLILLAAGCLTTMTGGIVAPVFPEMVQALNLDKEWAGMLVSTHALTSALSTPVMGVVADRTSKLKVLLVGLMLYAVVGMITPLMTTLPLLLVMRGLIGIASGTVAAATIGLLAGMYEGEQRSRILGYATSAMTTASILFPLLGGIVGRTHWQAVFLLYGMGIPLALIAAVCFHRTQAKTGSGLGTDPSGLGKILRNPDILKLYLFVAAAATIVYAVVIYTPVYLKLTIGAGPELNGFVLAVRAVGGAVTSAFAASRVARRFGKRGAIAFGFSLMGLTVLTIPFLTELVWILPTAVLFGVGFGVVTPNLYDRLAELSPPESRTTVLAIATGFNSLGQFICPLILGQIWDDKNLGLSVVFYTTAAIAGLACFMSGMHRTPKQV